MPFFLELILSVFLEIELSSAEKHFFFQLIYSCVVNSMSNAILAGKEKIMRRLALLLRVETHPALNHLLIDIVRESF